MVSIHLDTKSRKWRLMYSYRDKLNIKKTKKTWFYLSQKEFPELYETYNLNKRQFINKIKNKYQNLFISKRDWDNIFNKLEGNIKFEINKSGIFGEVHRLKWDIRAIQDSMNKLKKKYPKRKNKDYYNLLRKEVDSIEV